MKKLFSVLLAILLFLNIMILSACGNDIKLDPKNPITIEIWHYYNGPQQVAFDNLVNEFNETVGAKKGIVVDAVNYGNISALRDSVLDAADHKVGASELPDVFAAYADLAYAMDQKELIIDISQYLTKDEINEYVDSYIEESRLGKEDVIKIFPIAKSTEIFMLNKTDWDKFAQATGASMDSLETMEGLVATAKSYYEWTDSFTATPDDGKAFFGRDAMANYFIIGCKQLGTEIFSVKNGEITIQCDKDVIKKLWDHFYVPYINGYFAAYGRFRSDDAKTGKIIALVGSTSGSTYFPSEVVVNDAESYPIEVVALPTPHFQDSKPYAVQQGAGMSVIKSDPKTEYASIEFLKWFTEKDRNIQFSVSSGYLPVKKEANDYAHLEKELSKMPSSKEQDILSSVLKVAVNIISNDPLYTNEAFKNGTTAREVLEDSLSNKANEDLTAIQTLMQNGMSRQDAVALYDTPENFEQWFKEFHQQLIDAVQ